MYIYICVRFKFFKFHDCAFMLTPSRNKRKQNKRNRTIFLNNHELTEKCFVIRPFSEMLAVLDKQCTVLCHSPSYLSGLFFHSLFEMVGGVGCVCYTFKRIQWATTLNLEMNHWWWQFVSEFRNDKLSDDVIFLISVKVLILTRRLK